MAKYRSFEELPVWQEAARLFNAVLDLTESPGLRISAGFRNQLERAALSVSNNIAEGFERMTTAELLGFLGIARGSAGEVRSMIAVVRERPGLQAFRRDIDGITAFAGSCSRQITGWVGSAEGSTVKGKRHLSGPVKAPREAARAAAAFRLRFLRSLKPDHPLYNTPEAREARARSNADGESRAVLETRTDPP